MPSDTPVTAVGLYSRCEQNQIACSTVLLFLFVALVHQANRTFKIAKKWNEIILNDLCTLRTEGYGKCEFGDERRIFWLLSHRDVPTSLSSTQTQNQVEGRLLLDVVIRKSASVLELFPGEDQTLLVRGNA